MKDSASTNLLKRYMNADLISKAMSSTKNIATSKYNYILGKDDKEVKKTK